MVSINRIWGSNSIPDLICVSNTVHQQMYFRDIESSMNILMLRIRINYAFWLNQSTFVNTFNFKVRVLQISEFNVWPYFVFITHLCHFAHLMHFWVWTQSPLTAKSAQSASKSPVFWCLKCIKHLKCSKCHLFKMTINSKSAQSVL